ncbi:MAG: DUF2612 domain-containing protein [Clostridia bacterium]|nr:DUF2612 domain-containing protein [Clostridia bacterium]
MSRMEVIANAIIFFSGHQTKPLFMAFSNSILGQVEDLFQLFQGDAFDLETAEGFFLDTLGEISGVTRVTPGMTDEEFREFLRQRIALHHWDGTNGSLKEVLDLGFPGAGAFITDNMDGTVTGNVEFPCIAGIREMEG